MEKIRYLRAGKRSFQFQSTDMNTIDKNKKQAVIAGAGPAGLTGAYELLKHTDIHPVVFEESGDIGGISKTVRYQGNRMDIGGHRFFSKTNELPSGGTKSCRYKAPPLSMTGCWEPPAKNLPQKVPILKRPTA